MEPRDYPQATTNYYSTLTNKIAAGGTKIPAYQQILKDTKLNYLGNEYIANNYNELKNKMQQRYNEKSPKIEILYKQSMDGALQDVKKQLEKSVIRKGRTVFLIKRSRIMRKKDIL